MGHLIKHIEEGWVEKEVYEFGENIKRKSWEKTTYYNCSKCGYYYYEDNKNIKFCSHCGEKIKGIKYDKQLQRNIDYINTNISILEDINTIFEIDKKNLLLKYPNKESTIISIFEEKIKKNKKDIEHLKNDLYELKK